MSGAAGIAAPAIVLSSTSIIGIAVGGSAVLLLAIAFTAIYLVRRKDRIQRARLQNVEAEPLEQKELAAFLRSERPRDVCTPTAISFALSLPPDKRAQSLQLDTIVPMEDLEDVEDEAPILRTNTKRLSPTRALSRLSTGIRDPWPLANSSQMPHALHGLARLQSQSQSTITLNQVAPPGYMIQSDPKRPDRTYSRNGKTKVSKDVARTRSRRLTQRDSFENQFTTILRSTSERLKSSHPRRKSLSRTLTSFGRSGPPPLDRLPSPHMKIKVKESREALIDNKSTASATSSIYGEELIRTPTPDRKIARAPGNGYSRPKVSPASSEDTEDSLCVKKTPEVVPAALNSPSRSNRRELKNRRELSPVRMSPVAPHDYPSTSIRSNGVSIFGLGSPGDHDSGNDPFFSSVQVAKPLQMDNVRPLFIRKASFGREKPSNLPSPLKVISGNSQCSTSQVQPTVTFTTQHNPFQWSPQEASRKSPNTSHSRKKGHKRSKTVRMSVLPGARSSVSMVPEESEGSETETSPLKFSVPPPGVRLVEPSKSPSPSPRGSLLTRRQQSRPPSSPIFEPHIQLPARVSMGSTTTSPCGNIQIFSPTLPSPTRLYPVRLSPIKQSLVHLPTKISCKYDPDPEASRNDFLQSKPKLSPSTTRSRRECSVGPIFSPTELLDEMIGFPRPPPAPVVKTHKQKQSITFVPQSFHALPTRKPSQTRTPTQISTKDFPKPSNSPALSPNSEILKALEAHKVPQPVLTLPCIPGHLTGPRDLPGRVSSPFAYPSPSPSPSRSLTTKETTRGSLHQSICMLRRMNSDVSRYESPTSAYSLDFKTEQSPSPSPSPINFRDRYVTRGSKHYHNLSSRASQSLATSPGSKHRVSKHTAIDPRTSRIHLSRKRVLERARSFREMSSEAESEHIVDATPLEALDATFSSPVTEVSDIESQFTTTGKNSNTESGYSLSDDLAVIAAELREREVILELESPVKDHDWSDTLHKQDGARKPVVPERWSKIVLSPSVEESKENQTPRNNPRGSVTAPKSIESRHSHSSPRTSVLGNSVSGGNARGVSSGPNIVVTIDNEVKDTPMTKEVRTKLRKQRGSIWGKWNSGGISASTTRDSLYDSDGFLRSSPVRSNTPL